MSDHRRSLCSLVWIINVIIRSAKNEFKRLHECVCSGSTLIVIAASRCHSTVEPPNRQTNQPTKTERTAPLGHTFAFILMVMRLRAFADCGQHQDEALDDVAQKICSSMFIQLWCGAVHKRRRAQTSALGLIRPNVYMCVCDMKPLHIRVTHAGIFAFLIPGIHFTVKPVSPMRTSL